MARTSAERKRAFVDGMRNIGQKVHPGAPERSPVQLYLSEKAKDAIRQHRLLSRVASTNPLRDSEFVELAIARYDASIDTPSGDASAERVKLIEERRQLLKAMEELQRKLAVTVARKPRPPIVLPVAEPLQSSHADKLGSYRVWKLLQELKACLGGDNLSAASRHEAHRLVGEYLFELTVELDDRLSKGGSPP